MKAPLQIHAFENYFEVLKDRRTRRVSLLVRPLPSHVKAEKVECTKATYLDISGIVNELRNSWDL